MFYRDLIIATVVENQKLFGNVVMTMRSGGQLITKGIPAKKIGGWKEIGETVYLVSRRNDAIFSTNGVSFINFSDNNLIPNDDLFFVYGPESFEKLVASRINFGLVYPYDEDRDFSNIRYESYIVDKGQLAMLILQFNLMYRG